ncbi:MULTISPECIES: MarC family protein [unclassified Halobacteriovorax]|uniref:MarC family protein n=1 Tax=unclassified Halobacteriovorax TaxID=2639665 RepID=UPI000EA232E6|nr:MarC family protein [Halobacteriovorax sp. BALOs_7]AYF44718.1 membrane protein, MarC family [Halobacteriovorax sp. BALOs_7]
MKTAHMISFFVALLSVVNPIGALPMFMGLTKNLSKTQRKSMVRVCSIAVFVTLVISLFIGKKILSFFGISIGAFTVGGGILIFSMATSMINAKDVESKLTQDEMDDDSIREIGIVPLAIPLLAGPGAISTTIIYAQKLTSPIDWALSIPILLLAVLCIYIALINANTISEKVGQLGVNVTTRVMGLFLLAMSVEMITNGLASILPILKAQL